MTVSICIQLIAMICPAAAGTETASDKTATSWFDGKPPLGAKDQRRHLFRPYSAVKLDYLGANYCENLLDKRLNITSYSHQDFDSNRWDAWNLQFPDDASRIVEGLVWEDQYSSVGRLETVRRIMKGLLAAHIPGTQGYHFFRHRSAGKTYLIFDDSAGTKEGRLLLSTWGDAVQGEVSIGFRAQFKGTWLEQKDFIYADTHENAGTPGVARSPQYWNESPFVFTRNYSRPDQTVRFTGRYGLSDEDLPLEFAYESPQAEKLAITIGEPGKHIPLLWDAKTPGIIDFPDRKTQWRSDKDGDQILNAPKFNYLVLHKTATWACPGYSSALLVMWDGQPEAIEALAENGYGQVRIIYSNKEGVAINGGAKGNIRLFPFHWLNDDDMEYVYRNAESFLARGKLMHNGFPSQQMVNAIPAGLAAGAVMLTRYKDPFAQTAQIEAINAVDAFLDPEHKGRRFARLFFEVKAAAWMVQLGKELNDSAMVEKYTAWVRLTMDRMLTPEGSYDGKAWGDGWTHFNCMKATWLAYEATGIEKYREVYERALDVYTIDNKGVYRNGEPLKAPGGFDVYAGALPIAVWGHWGLKDSVDQLINLSVPNGWHNPEIPVADLWNDAGAGPWSQDDANPDMLGYMLRGYHIPTEPKHLLPTGAFAKFNETGDVEATWAPVVDNPFFQTGGREIRVLKKGEILHAPKIKTIELDVTGQQTTPPCIEQVIPIRGVKGAALDLRMTQGQYQVEVSPDGKHWIPRLDTWCDKPTTRSLDLSFLVGGLDELIRTQVITPPDDTTWIQSSDGSEVVRAHCRTITPEGSVVYRLTLPRIQQCHLEFLVGNNYRIDLSRDGKTWHEALSPSQIVPAKDDNQKDAAWLRMIDATNYIGSNDEVYIRLRNAGNDAVYGGASAFLRRIAVYASYKTPKLHVRITGAPFTTTNMASPGFNAEWVRVRTW